MSREEKRANLNSRVRRFGWGWLLDGHDLFLILILVLILIRKDDF